MTITSAGSAPLFFTSSENVNRLRAPRDLSRLLCNREVGDDHECLGCCSVIGGKASASLSVAVAVFVIVPRGGVTTMVTVAVVPGFSVPRLQVMKSFPTQVPAVEFAETNVAPAGSVSVSVTPVAVSSPLFVTVIV